MIQKTLRNLGLEVVLDAREIFPHDPGNGTPVMVYAKDRQFHATYNCAIGTGELWGGGEQDGYVLSDRQLNWLNSPSVDAEIEALYNSVPEEK